MNWRHLPGVDSKALKVALVFSVVAAGCSSSPPTERDLENVLQAEYGNVLKVTDVKRVNGIDYPAGNGSPQRYEVQFSAKLNPSGPITIQMTSPLQTAALTGSSANGAVIKGLAQGHTPDPKGLNAFFDISTSLLRVDESSPVTIDGVVSFLKTENGWQKQSLQSRIPQAFVTSMKAREELPGAWYDGGPSCMKIARKDRADRFALKVWYCNAGEPEAALSVSLNGTELSGDGGAFTATLQADGSMKAKFDYPPPNHGYERTGTFRKSRR